MKVESLFGGKTRFAVLETLADATDGTTAYQIAITKGLDPAATYRCLAELSELGIVKSQTRERNQTFYKLSDGPGKAAAVFLRSLKQKTPQVMDFETWMSPQMRSERMTKIVRLNRLDMSKTRNPKKKQDIEYIMSKRTPGELSALITASKIAFSELFEQKDGAYILKAR